MPSRRDRHANALFISYRAVPDQIVGHWPSLLLVTENASLQLDPAPRLTRAGDAYLQPPAARGRTLGRVHPPLRRRDTGDEGRPRGRTGTDLR